MPRYPTKENGDIKFRAYGEGTLWPYESMRMISCKLVNKTKYTWRWEDFRLQEFTNFNSFRPGVYNPRTDFETHPTGYKMDFEIHPNGSTIVELYSSDNWPRGVEAWITYSTDAGPIEFHWNSPYLGSNSYHTYKLPAEFESIHNSAIDRYANGTTAAPVDPEYFGSRIDGKRPQFEWTIKQRPETAKPKKMDHFYTTHPYGEGVGSSGHTAEGVVGYVYATQQPNTVPLYRYFHSGIFDHFYTRDANGEGASDWKFESIQCYLPANKDHGAVALYRFYGNHDHFYTTDPNGEIALQVGYKAEGEAGYVFPTQVEGTIPLYRWLLSV